MSEPGLRAGGVFSPLALATPARRFRRTPDAPARRRPVITAPTASATAAVSTPYFAAAGAGAAAPVRVSRRPDQESGSSGE